MADFGAKGSAPGYDVNTAVDFLQLFNSSWPLLKIEHGDTGSITLNGTPQIIYTHSLNYPPLYFIISGGKFTAFAGLSYGIGVDSSVLAYDGSSTLGGTFDFYYYVCRLPLNVNFTSPIITGSEVTTTTNDSYGLKVMKPGKDTGSTDLRDYSLYSSSRSLMVHKVDYGPTAFDGTDYTRTVAHGLSYVPIGFCYIKFGAGGTGIGHNADYFYLTPPPVGVQDASYTIDSTNMVITENSSFITAPGDATSVILKDPFTKQTISRTYP